jgi:hypothetical protein
LRELLDRDLALVVLVPEDHRATLDGPEVALRSAAQQRRAPFVTTLAAAESLVAAAEQRRSSRRPAIHALQELHDDRELAAHRPAG